MASLPASWAGFVWSFLRSPKAGWIIGAITTFLVLFLIIGRLAGLDPIDTVLRTKQASKPEQRKLDEDPLGIAGKWTYETDLNDDKDPKNKYAAVKGENTVITADKNGYTMQGQRTQYKEKNSNTFQAYPYPIIIEFSRISFSPDHNSFYFYFKIDRNENINGSEGFVDMKITQPTKSTMYGFVHYLRDDGTWSKAHITFYKQ